MRDQASTYVDPISLKQCVYSKEEIKKESNRIITVCNDALGEIRFKKIKQEKINSQKSNAEIMQ
jgi:hypothetical protein